MTSLSLPQLRYRMLTAIHEAGHTAMALVTRDRFTYVTLRASKDNPNPRLYTRLRTLRTPFQKRRAIAVCLAGPAAHALFLCPPYSYLHWLSLADIAELVRAAGESDIDEALSLTTFQPGTEEANEFIADVLGIAVDILREPEVWLGVLRLASALYNRSPKSYIGYREARRIFFDEKKGSAK